MLALVGAAGARAGEWIQVSCANPNGSAAPSDGWSVGTINSPAYGSGNSARCAPGSPMYAILSTDAPDAVGATEYLQYAPPAGSTLSGGTVNVNLAADGGGTGASGTAVLYEPGLVYPGDVFYQCASGVSPPCNDGTNDYSGQISLPSGLGGDFFIAAGCGGEIGQSCDSGGSHGAWALVQVNSADFVLANASAPQASGFSGSALQRTVGGTAHLVFTANDPSGPGVYGVGVRIGGRVVWAGSPSTNSGRCIPVGSIGGVLMFDWQQPCPETEVVDAPVPTRGLSDGRHELSLTVTDAAGNSSTVLDQTITTSNPGVTPVPRGRRAVHAHFNLYWRWNGSATRLDRVVVVGLPRDARVSAGCAGRGCPRLRVRSEQARRIGALLAALRGMRFRAGDRLLLTVSAPRRIVERIEVLIRDGRKPTARLL